MCWSVNSLIIYLLAESYFDKIKIKYKFTNRQHV